MVLKIDHSDRDDSDLGELHEINVTPFIDIMLVLLIVFMVAAPLATVDIHVDLPASSAEKQTRPTAPVFVTVREDLTLAVGDEAVEIGALEEALGAATAGDKSTRLFLRADKVVAYGELMEVMNQLREAGYLKLALVGLEEASE